MYIKGGNPLCLCGNPHRKNGRDCLECHNAAERRRRHARPMTPEERKKSNARSLAHINLKLGKLKRQPCEHSGCKQQAQMHHDDYDKPLDVRWLCRDHHVGLHNEKNRSQKRKDEQTLADIVAKVVARQKAPRIKAASPESRIGP